jgi:competence protein ComEA
MIWSVKIYLAKIKDCKGKDLKFLNKKSLLTIIWPKIPRSRHFPSITPAVFCPEIILMKWKEIVIDYLTFTRRDRIGIIAILAIILSVFFLPKMISQGNSKMVLTDTAWMASLKKLEQKDKENNKQYSQYADDNSNNYQYDRSINNYYGKPKGELFYFDPNTLTTEGWQKLGLREKTISTIQNYLSKGGHFKKPEDLQRIYGLFPNEFERIAPFIKIESSGETNNYKDYSENLPTENQPAKIYPSRYSVVDINSADTTAFIALHGIGSKLAARIVNYRDKLGGFYSANQIGETYGLPDSTFQKIKQYLKLENTSIRKIDINTATVDELKLHPYIKWSLANPIVAYRNEHGPFAKVEDIKKVMAVTEEVYNKIVPYLAVQ